MEWFVKAVRMLICCRERYDRVQEPWRGDGPPQSAAVSNLNTANSISEALNESEHRAGA